MPQLDDYCGRYENAKVSRDDSGVLEVTFHTNGGSLVWSESAHREIPLLLADIGADPENRVVILTGAGDTFCSDTSDWRVWESMEISALWDKLYFEGKRLLENLLNIDVPVIGAVNGPAREHAELLAFSDIVLAADGACFQDAVHFARGIVSGDGVHVIWPLLLGPNRGRYFLLTGQEISAAQAQELGVVAEVLPASELMPRAREIAAQLAEKPLVTLRCTRVALTQRWKRHLLDDLGYGLMLESRAAITNANANTTDWTGHEHADISRNGG